MTPRIRSFRLALVLAAGVALGIPPAGGAQSSEPFRNDPLGALKDVTNRWRHFQPAERFCVRPSATTYTPGGDEATATGRDRACRRSGFGRRAKNLVKVHIRTPSFCTGCRRFFIDFTRIPATDELGDRHARGHAYYHLDSINNTYTVDPKAHSPNTKNFTNDKLVAPHRSIQERIIGFWDMHSIEYVTDPANFIHTASQGRYYIGPWYLNRDHERVRGVYLDVNVADAVEWPSAQANAIGYMAGFNSAGACPTDDDLLYGGCVDWMGRSSNAIDPFAG